MTLKEALGDVNNAEPEARLIFRPDQSKRVFRKIIFDQDRREQINKFKRAQDFSLLEIFNSWRFHPIMEKRGYAFSNLISWMTGSTDCYADKPGQDVARDDPNGCRLCQSSIENREHLLTDCPGTIHLVTEFFEKIRDISSYKYNEGVNMCKKWLSIIGGGCIPVNVTNPSYRD